MSDDRPAVLAATAVANHETEREIRRAEDEGMPALPNRPHCHFCNRGFFVPDIRDGWYCDHCGVRVKFVPDHAVTIVGIDASQDDGTRH